MLVFAKIGTPALLWTKKLELLRKFIKRANLTSFSENLGIEINYIQNIFTEYNDYLLKVVNNLIDQDFLHLVQQETLKTKNQQI